MLHFVTGILQCSLRIAAAFPYLYKNRPEICQSLLGVDSVQYAAHSVQWTVCSEQCTGYSVQWTVYSVQCKVLYVHRAVLPYSVCGLRWKQREVRSTRELARTDIGRSWLTADWMSGVGGSCKGYRWPMLRAVPSCDMRWTPVMEGEDYDVHNVLYRRRPLNFQYLCRYSWTLYCGWNLGIWQRNRFSHPNIAEVVYVQVTPRNRNKLHYVI